MSADITDYSYPVTPPEGAVILDYPYGEQQADDEDDG